MNVLDLFSGIGGFSLGLERAGFKTVAFCEIEDYPVAVLRKHWPGVHIFRDVRDLNADVLEFFDIPKIGVICGGFPCQDISLAGKGAGLDGERSGLWREFCRLIGEIRPTWAIIENVPALRTRGYDRIKSDLEGINYACWPFVVSAADVGAHHLRKRVWIIAYTVGQQLRVEPGRGSRQNGEGQIFDTIARGERAVTDPLCARRAHRSRLPGSQTRRGSVAAPNIDRFAAKRSSVSREECFSWPPEPDVGRVVHGLPNNMDRIKSLGNAVVPQIPEIIGRVIMSLDGISTSVAPAAKPCSQVIA